MKLYLGCARKGLVQGLEKSSKKGWQRSLVLAVAVLFLLYPVAQASFAAPMPAKALPQPAPAPGNPGGCALNSARGQIQHVIYIQFDNVHFTRDNPNVPSDLEQMPHLLNFLTNNGVLSTNHHTPLKSHTADDIITSETGLYGDRQGQPISNSFDYFVPGSANFTSSFQYWTDVVSQKFDPTYYMIGADGKNTPAPWVAWTRAGCNVGAVSIANIELENVFGDLVSVFGSNPTQLSAAQAEVKANRSKAVADFEGIAIHCAAGNALCSNANGGVPDLLPQEPVPYSGYNALFGHVFVAPVISPGGPLTDLDGNLVTDSHGNQGFPGFSGISAAQTLSYVAAMQEHGVPVTYAYISDAHENHKFNIPYVPAVCKSSATDPELAFGIALGPGDPCYVAQLAAYDEAFGKFFTRLANDGLNTSNTLFVITADEGDHFAGGAPFNQGCDGVTIACNYINPATNQTVIGELDADMAGLLATEQNVTAGFDVTFDMVGGFYVYGNPPVGDPLARSFEQAASKLTAVNPRTGNTDKLSLALADPVEMKLLHMVTGDPDRTPTFVMFGDPDYFFLLTGNTTCSPNPCVSQGPGFAWNHGGFQKEIVTTWLGMAGPGVKNVGLDTSVWSDHTDIRPTMLTLAGLQDDYQHEGRALVEDFNDWALPAGVSANSDLFTQLADAFKAINAPNGPLGHASLKISTVALEGDNNTYTNLENKLSGITSTRDMLAGQMLSLLENAEFSNQPLPQNQAQTLIDEAYQLLDYVQNLAQNLNQNQQ